MKTLNVTLSDETHIKLLKLKEKYGAENLNDTVAEAIEREHRKEEASA